MKSTLYHVRFFLFGFIYYLIIPLWVVSSKILYDAPGMEFLYTYYKAYYVSDYLIIVTCLLFFFLLGAYLPFSRKKNRHKLTPQTYYGVKKLFGVAFPIFLISQYVVYQNRSHLFQGYTLEFESQFVGTICTANMLVLFLYLYNKIGQNNKKYNRYLKYLLIVLIIEIFSLGTRMYAMISFVALLTYFHQKKLLNTKKMLIVGLCFFFLILVIGIWRSGDNVIDIDSLVYVAFGEPLFTWISAISMFDMNKLPLFAFPYEFISSIINFIPTVLFPNKGDFIVPGFLKYDAPLGARSVVYTLISNFGVLGSFMAIFLLGYYLTYVRLNWKSTFGQTYYFCVCGIIPFQFFRDSCLEVNKAFFYNFLILPALLIVIQGFLFVSKKKRKNVEYQLVQE